MARTQSEARLLEAYEALHKPTFEKERLHPKDVMSVIRGIAGSEDAKAIHEVSVSLKLDAQLDALMMPEKFTDDDIAEDWNENDAKLCIGAIIWLTSSEAPRNEFLREMGEAYSNYGLSIGQLRGVLNFLRASASKEFRPFSEDESPAPPPEIKEGLDLRSLPSGRYAVPDGETRLKVQIDVVKEGRWNGFVFVKDAAVYGGGQRYGLQRPGGFYTGKIEDSLRAIVANPLEAMAEYGRLTNTCGACGRALEDEESVRLGIGPICRRKLGWTMEVLSNIVDDTNPETSEEGRTDMTTETTTKKTAPAKAATKPAPAKKAPAAKAPAPAKKAAPVAKRNGKLRITTTNGSAVEHPELRDRKHARQIIRKLSEGKTLVLVDGDEKTTYKDGGQA